MRARGLHGDAVDVEIGSDVFRPGEPVVILVTAYDACGIDAPENATAMLSLRAATFLAKKLDKVIAEAKRSDRR